MLYFTRPAGGGIGGLRVKEVYLNKVQKGGEKILHDW